MDSTSIIRKFERFLFKGVPDTPETIYDRGGYSHVYMRSTGQSTMPEHSENQNSEQILIGTYVYDIENKTEAYTPAPKDE